MDEPIKILHIFGQMQRGGAEMRTLELMRYLDRRRYQFHFGVLSGLPGDLDGEIQALGGQVHLLPLGARFPGQFRHLLRQQRFRVVHSHVHYFSGFILRLAAREKTPIRITHFRNTEDGQGQSLRRRAQRALLRRWTDRHSTVILAVSEGAMAASWPRWRQDPRCRVIYNGLDAGRFAGPADRPGVIHELGLPADCCLYLHVGRMDPQKNHPRLVSIFQAIARQQPSARLVMVGRGGNEIEQEVCRRLDQLGLADRVRLAGVREDVPRLLKAADLMLFPSLWEGLPGAVLEACAAGTPVLASDLPGVREIAAHCSRVRFLSLEAGDTEWATAATEAAATPLAGDDRDSASQWLSDSPFDLCRCAQAHRAVWERGAVPC